MIIQHWHQGSEADYWKDFSDTSGQRLTYTAIIDHLAQELKESNNKMANPTKQGYGDRFSEVFWYNKNGVHCVKVKACDIVKQY